MNLSSKDRTFLCVLRALFDEQVLRVEFVDSDLKRLVLRQNYGSRIETAFGLSRQGVRWRFSRLFNQIYPHAYATILWVESSFGTELRQYAMAMAKQQAELCRRDRHTRNLVQDRVRRGDLEW